MAIAVNIVVGHFAKGNPGSLGEPMGLWVGQVAITGDATGGRTQVTFVPQNPADTPTLSDQRRQYVYFVDGVVGRCDVDPGNISNQMAMHMDRANAAIPGPFTQQVVADMADDSIAFRPVSPLVLASMQRMPIFWEAEELASGNNIISRVIWENNVDLANYSAEAYGRYYDKQILANRGFGRLIAPSAISQF